MALKEHYEGHRARLRERFLKAGGDALADYELLELILYAAHSRGDVKPLAKELLGTFKTFPQVLSADIQDLLKVKGVGNAVVAALKSVHVSVERCLKAEILQRPILKSWPQIVNYCEIMMRDLKYEQLRLLFLDRQNNLIADEVQQNGTVDQATIYTREIVKRALELGASGLILVHNHPSGDPTPSNADIEATFRIREASERLGIKVFDHIIVGKGQCRSLRNERMI
ncbi:MAG: DNA repair protein RadC [Candidatus Paracaedimonas acanthamoebae]|uniref:DNA repair protein RadC n=1 Tax=Candidatus Paracaedimonas acanthamoebae TaxID=244581 RepID=A0A8J7TSX3_9PROT|nr:DNA repair protein RadC [Candidatus Paracaedimonas acanthamoebae]